jgi:hypothetical protein
MSFQEFPKSLYMNGEWEGHHVIVHDKDEEDAKREEGYKMLVEGPDVGGDEKEVLIARAKELGISATKNWGIPKLQEAIAEAEKAQ